MTTVPVLIHYPCCHAVREIWDKAVPVCRHCGTSASGVAPPTHEEWCAQWGLQPKENDHDL